MINRGIKNRIEIYLIKQTKEFLIRQTEKQEAGKNLIEANILIIRQIGLLIWIPRKRWEIHQRAKLRLIMAHRIDLIRRRAKLKIDSQFLIKKIQDLIETMMIYHIRKIKIV